MLIIHLATVVLKAVADDEIIHFQQKTFDQISAYNLLLKVDFLIVSNGLQHHCCKMDYDTRSYTFLEGIPDYEKL